MRTHTRRRTARVLTGLAAASAIALTGCSGDSAGPEAGEVTTQDLQELEDQVGAFDDRIGALEDEVGGMAAPAQGGDQPDVVGQEVTVSAAVSELITSSDVGSAFRIAGQTGPSVAVLATAPPEGLEVDDVVQITGTVQMVSRDSFETDFGIAEDDLFDDPDAFFGDAEGQPAIAATSIEILQEQAEG